MCVPLCVCVCELTCVCDHMRLREQCALKRFECSKPIFLRFPPPNKKIPPAKFPIPLTGGNFPPPRYSENPVYYCDIVVFFMITH